MKVICAQLNAVLYYVKKVKPKNDTEDELINKLVNIILQIQDYCKKETKDGKHNA